MSGASIADARELRFAEHKGNGVLTVFPGGDPDGVPFTIARVFTITGVTMGGSRGHHAHRSCTQLVACLAGGATVSVDDGCAERTFALSSGGTGVLIPPGLWNVITFGSPGTVVAVFCDRPYDESDYVRDRAEYLRLAGVR